MRMKEWVLLLLTGVLTVGALSVWARNAKKDEDDKEETKIEQTQDAKLDHSLFETEGTYTTRALAMNDIIGGKWIRAMIPSEGMKIMSLSNKFEGFEGDMGVGIGFNDPSGLKGCGGFGFAYTYSLDGFETYEGEGYVDIYLEEKTYNVVVSQDGESIEATLTITNETVAVSFFGEEEEVSTVFFELIPN